MESINKAIEEKIQPKIANIDEFILNLEKEFHKHKRETQTYSQTIDTVKDLQKNMSILVLGFNKRTKA